MKLIKMVVALCLVFALVGCSQSDTADNNGFGVSREELMKELQSDGILEWDYEGDYETANKGEMQHMYSIGSATGTLVLAITENNEAKITQILLTSDIDILANYLIASGKIAEIVIPDVDLVNFAEKYKIAEKDQEEISGIEKNVSVTSGILNGMKVILFEAE